MHFRVGSHFDVEPVAGFSADKLYQFICVAEFTTHTVTTRKVTTQCNNATDTEVLVLTQNRADGFFGTTDTRQMRCCLHPFALDFNYRIQRTLLCRATGTKRDGKILRLQLRQFCACHAQFFRTFWRLRREKLNTEIRASHDCSKIKVDKVQEITLYNNAPPVADQNPVT